MRKVADCLCRNGIQQRKNSWEDGVYGTNCPILPGQNYTYVMQVKDQIGSYFYFPTLDFHKAAGGFGGIRVLSRPLIPVPYPPPAGDFTLLTGDWFKTNHTVRLNRTENIHALIAGKTMNFEGVLELQLLSRLFVLHGSLMFGSWSFDCSNAFHHSVYLENLDEHFVSIWFVGFNLIFIGAKYILLAGPESYSGQWEWSSFPWWAAHQWPRCKWLCIHSWSR